VALARALLTAPLGEDRPRVFLAGGAFKTLLHGRPPRDLDLWAETPADRARLVERLRARGAETRPAAPGAERFVLAGQRIEVSFQVEEMEPRLARFDLGLSCIAVAFRGEDAVPLVHPRALASVARREVLLIAITCWQLALATLVRARRYAKDLDYRVSPDLEAEAWSLFAARSPEEQAEMIAQLDRHLGADTYGVRREAAGRLARRG
jgi:hypothetical protein